MKFSEALTHMENGGECVYGTTRYRINDAVLEMLVKNEWQCSQISIHTCLIINWQKAPTKKKVWVNLYRGIYGTLKNIVGFEYVTQEEADEKALAERIACVEIEVEEDGE